MPRRTAPRSGTTVANFYLGAYVWCMALNIKSAQVERLAAEVARMTGETKTEAIRRALEERKQRLSFRIGPGDRKAELLRFLEREVWPRIPADAPPMTKAEREAILGIDPERGY